MYFNRLAYPLGSFGGKVRKLEELAVKYPAAGRHDGETQIGRLRA